jgi:hypothetical protein
MSIDMTATEAKATLQQIRAIEVQGLAKVPSTRWFKDVDGDPEKVTSITLIVKDISERDLRRLAQAALSEIPLDIEITPRMEQAEFDVD